LQPLATTLISRLPVGGLTCCPFLSLLDLCSLPYNYPIFSWHIVYQLRSLRAAFALFADGIVNMWFLLSFSVQLVAVLAFTGNFITPPPGTANTPNVTYQNGSIVQITWQSDLDYVALTMWPTKGGDLEYLRMSFRALSTTIQLLILLPSQFWQPFELWRLPVAGWKRHEYNIRVFRDLQPRRHKSFVCQR
jgi:hypothetical protein